MVLVNSFRYPSSNIRYERRNIRAVLDKKDLGLGTLFVSESTLCWQEKDSIGFSIPYTNISLHAISRDNTVFSSDCVYISLDGRFYMPGDQPPQQDEDSDSDAESENESSELILVPYEDDDNASIVNIYEAIKVCQELNPDPEDIDDDDDNLYADAEDELEEGHYVIQDRGAGDADIDDIARRLEEHSVDGTYAQNGNDDDEFEDAD
ncbi:methylosome subunit pICln [Dendroctonus ponderosae]